MTRTHATNRISRLPSGMRHRPASGFTLIELLTSLTILAVIVGMLAVMLSASLDVWRGSQARTRILIRGRTAMDAIAQDLRQAVAYTNVTIGDDQIPIYGATNNWILFTRVRATPATNQYATETVHYGMDATNGAFALARRSMRTPLASVGTTNLLPVADGLAALRFTPPADTNATGIGAVQPYLDVYMEFLDAPDVKAASRLSGTNQNDFVERHVVRFGQRVFFAACRDLAFSIATPTTNASTNVCATIQGNVYIDVLGDGHWDPPDDDNGVLGAEVALCDASNPPVELATKYIVTTDGYFEFTVPPPEAPSAWLPTYTLRLIYLPPYYVYTGNRDGPGTNMPLTVTVAAVPTLTGNYFLATEPTSISGGVYEDVNGNGIVDPEDTNGLANVNVQLWKSGKQVATTNTDAAGLYVFTNLMPGAFAYTVREVDLNGWYSTDDTWGLATDNRIQVPLLASGTPATNNNFYDTQYATILGNVLVDLNGDGFKEDPEDDNGISFVQIGLFSNNIPVQTTITTTNGFYMFTNVLAGTYTVVETDPDGWISTGNCMVHEPLNPNNIDNLIALTFLSGQTASNQYFLDAVPTSISGGVFVDVNGNGIVDPEDTLGVTNVTMRLWTTNYWPTFAGSNWIAETTTAADGRYAFLNVIPGSYMVRETDPCGWYSTTDTWWLATDNVVRVTVFSGTPSITNNFYDTQYATIQGNVYVDLNANGLKDFVDTNGIVGVTNQLLDATNGLVATVTTTTNGFYAFTNVPAGTYTVRETDLNGYVSTGNRDGPGTNNVLAVTVFSGQESTNNFFLDTVPTSISGGVFVDANGNGLIDPEDTNGLANVTIQLQQWSSAMWRLAATGTTDIAGGYAFTNRIPGTYAVHEIVPDGWYATLPTNGIATVYLVSNMPSATNNFYDAQFAILAGRVWQDDNTNGQIDAGESMLTNVFLFLDANTNGVYDPLVRQTHTDTNGVYHFDQVPDGVCAVRVNTNSLPPTLTATFDADGADTPNVARVTIVNGLSRTNVDFGYHNAQ